MNILKRMSVKLGMGSGGHHSNNNSDATSNVHLQVPHVNDDVIGDSSQQQQQQNRKSSDNSHNNRRMSIRKSIGKIFSGGSGKMSSESENDGGELNARRSLRKKSMKLSAFGGTNSQKYKSGGGGSGVDGGFGALSSLLQWYDQGVHQLEVERKYMSAIQNFDSVLELEPNSQGALIQRAISYWKLSKANGHQPAHNQQQSFKSYNKSSSQPPSPTTASSPLQAALADIEKVLAHCVNDSSLANNNNSNSILPTTSNNSDVKLQCLLIKAQLLAQLNRQAQALSTYRSIIDHLFQQQQQAQQAHHDSNSTENDKNFLQNSLFLSTEQQQQAHTSQKLQQSYDRTVDHFMSMVLHICSLIVTLIISIVNNNQQQLQQRQQRFVLHLFDRLVLSPQATMNSYPIILKLIHALNTPSNNSPTVDKTPSDISPTDDGREEETATDDLLTMISNFDSDDEENDFSNKMSSLMDGVLSNADRVRLMNTRARLLVQLKSYAEANILLNNVLELDPSNGDAWIMSALVYERRNNLKAAIECFSTLLDMKTEQFTNSQGVHSSSSSCVVDNDSSGGGSGGSGAANHSGDYYASMNAVGSESEESELYFKRGSLHFRMGQYVQAKNDLDRAIESNAHVREYYVMRGMICCELLAFAEAVQDYSLVLERYQENMCLKQLVDIWLNRSKCHMHMGDLTSAMSDAKLALENDPENDLCTEAVQELEEMTRDGN